MLKIENLLQAVSLLIENVKFLLFSKLVTEYFGPVAFETVASSIKGLLVVAVVVVFRTTIPHTMHNKRLNHLK